MLPIKPLKLTFCFINCILFQFCSQKGLFYVTIAKLNIIFKKTIQSYIIAIANYKN